MKLSKEEIEALKVFIGNTDSYLTAHILSKTMSEEEIKNSERILLCLYNRIIKETE